MSDISIALLVGDRVVAMTDDVATVRVAAGMLASAPHDADEPAVMWPIAEGRRVSCELIALNAAPA